MRSGLLLAGVLAILPVPFAAAQAAPRLVLMQPEIEGDLGDLSNMPTWQQRLDRLESKVEHALQDQHLYAVIDPQPAADLFRQYSQRASVYQCVPCAVTVAERVGAERILSLRVHRMSQLVLNLHAVLRDAGTGDVRYARYLSFRGDTDEAWAKAADFLIRDMSGIPADRL